jgi:hypothetical protein
VNGTYTFCKEYSCIEQGMEKIAPNLGFIALAVCLGYPCLVLLLLWDKITASCGCEYSVGISRMKYCYLIFHLGFVFIALLEGGVMSMIVGEGINMVLIVLTHFYVIYRSNRANNVSNVSSTRNDEPYNEPIPYEREEIDHYMEDRIQHRNEVELPPIAYPIANNSNTSTYVSTEAVYVEQIKI